MNHHVAYRFLLVYVTLISVSRWPVQTALAQDAPMESVRARPQMPPSFDRETVQHLIAQIEQGQNATILKIGYFLRGGNHPLAVEEGYTLLTTAIAQEKIGSRRWLMLATVKGFAAFRLRKIPAQEAFDSYKAIFAHAEQAQKIGTPSIVRQAIQDYVAIVAGRLADTDLLGDERTKLLLFKAWSVYVRMQNLGESKQREPLWAQAVERLSVGHEFVEVAEKSVRDSAVKPTYGMLQTLAAVYVPLDSARAIELLAQAKALLPHDNARQVHWYYTTLVELLELNEKLPEAVTQQQEWVNLTGRGQALLLFLRWKNGEDAVVNQMLQDLAAPTASEQEINEAGQRFSDAQRNQEFEEAKRKEAAGHGVRLLSQYLLSSRSRDIEQELQARLTLGGLFFRQSQLEQARKTLETGALEPSTLSKRAQQRFNDIKRLREALDKTTVRNSQEIPPQ